MDYLQIAIISVLILAIVTALVLFIIASIEPHKLELNKYIMGKPDGNPDLRLFFFSDLHAEFCFVSAEKICEAIKTSHSVSPLDAVIFGGDIVNHKFNYKIGRTYLLKVAATCRELDIPFLGVTGNHDYKFKKWHDRHCGFTVIEDTYVIFNSAKDGSEIAISGVNDSGRKQRVWYDIPQTPEGMPNILVAHNPDYVLHIPDNTRVDYMLSGHIHGGQIKTPFRIEFTLLRAHDILPKEGYTEGVVEYDGTPIFISRGIGCVKLPLRLGSKPEASVVEIYI